MQFHRAVCVLCLVLTTRAFGYGGNRKQPVFVGVKTCTRCHQGAGMGSQCSIWMNTKHARAYAVLAQPEAKLIAELSGVPQTPQESPLCLGCHATGAHAEDWEKDDTFYTEDGVQCEHCHGPGSEYMTEAVMLDRQRSQRAGLLLPAERDCLVCHRVKGSHVAVHTLPKLDVSQGVDRIAHPTPVDWRYRRGVNGPEVDGASDLPKYTGSYACGTCHRGEGYGFQFSKWRMSAHARAYAVLGTERARDIARQQGLTEDPQSSPACLKCHTSAYHDPAGGQTDAYWIYEGVGCEACHGAGSRYAPDAIMRDPRAAELAGLKKPTQATCLTCHQDSHEKPFDFEKAWQAIAHKKEMPQVKAPEPVYKTPLNLALHPDGRRLYVACEASDSVVVVDVPQRKKIGEIPVGRQPHDVTFSPDGATAYVSNRLDDSVSVIDVRQERVTATLPVGDEPHGLLTDPQGAFLYVLNTSADSISVIDTRSLQEVRRLVASRNPWSLSLAPDGRHLLVSNNLSRFVKLRAEPLSEVTMIDTERQQVTHRFEVPASNLLQGLAWHPQGAFAITTLNRTKNLVPMTRLMQGWTITNGLGILWADGQVDQVLLDEPSLCFPDPADVAFTPDGRRALVTSSGSNRVAVVDVTKLVTLLTQASAHERERVFPNHLGKPTEFVIKHIETEHSPRGVLVTPDGRLAIVTNALDDSLSVIDMETLGPATRIDLGGPREITQARWGEQLFHSADIAFQRQFSCHSCHPDGHVDGLTYDIEPDGIGIAPVDNRTLRGILDTAPFKWSGLNPSLQRQCGPRLAVFFTRIDPFTPDELEALDNYIRRIPRPPNRYRPLGAELTDAQRRGKFLFERTLTNDGRIIPMEQRCHTCHCPPLYTDRSSHDVGTFMDFDKDKEYDTPHLNNIYDSAPYLHNGSAATLEEIWTTFNPEDKHGFTNDMTKDQLNDLIEYIRTL